MTGGRLGDPAVVGVALQSETVPGRRVPLKTKSTLSHVPGIGSVLSIGEQRGSATEGLAVDPIIGMSAKPATITGGSESAQLGAATTRDQKTPRVFRVLRDDVD